MVEGFENIVSGLLSGNRGSGNRSRTDYTIATWSCVRRRIVVSEGCSLGSIEIVGRDRSAIR